MSWLRNSIDMHDDLGRLLKRLGDTWWSPLMLVAAFMLLSLIVALVPGDLVSPAAFGNGAEWATAFGTVAALSRTIWVATENKKIEAAESFRVETAKQVLADLGDLLRKIEQQSEKTELALSVAELDEFVQICKKCGVLSQTEFNDLHRIANRITKLPTAPNSGSDRKKIVDAQSELHNTAQRLHRAVAAKTNAEAGAAD